MLQLFPRAALALALCATATACASSGPPRLPPLTPEPTSVSRPGQIVWHDLLTQDLPRARAFYTALFGWTYVEQDGYLQVHLAGRPIAGMIAREDPERRSEWVFSMSVLDTDRAAALVVEYGGIIEREPIDVPERGRIALIGDPEGALILLLRSSSGDPPRMEPTVGDWLWRELWSHDVPGAERFYGSLLGVSVRQVGTQAEPYYVFETGGTAHAGIVVAPPEVGATWLPYVRVSDVSVTATRAASLGARVVMQDEHTAILIDPSGAPIGIQRWDGPRADAAEELR